MEVTINIPEELGKQLTNQWGNSPQKVLEALAVEGYRQRVLTSAQVQELLNLESRWETEKLLSDYQAYLYHFDQLALHTDPLKPSSLKLRFQRGVWGDKL